MSTYTDFETTKIFSSDGKVNQEKMLTLREYFNFGRDFLPGMFFCLIDPHEDDGDIRNPIYEAFFVGHCTPYHEPSTNDGGFGWNLNDPRMDKFIAEIHYPPKHLAKRSYERVEE